MSLIIRKHSRKPLIGRRQYHAQIMDGVNYEIIWRTTEGYNNRKDRDWAIDKLLLELPMKTKVIDDDSNELKL
jgi:hypothetical protein